MKAYSLCTRPVGVLLLSICMAGACWATSLQDALSSQERGDFTSAFNQFKQLAVSGDAAAQFELSLLYQAGRGTPQDAKQAMHWLRMAATRGNVQAQSNLGVAFAKGRGLAQDPLRAYAWLAAAATSGDSVAMTNRDLVARTMTEQQIMQAKALWTSCQSSGFKACL